MTSELRLGLALFAASAMAAAVAGCRGRSASEQDEASIDERDPAKDRATARAVVAARELAPDVKRDWLERDVVSLLVIRRMLPPKGDASQVIEELGVGDSSPEQLGFESSRVAVHRYGGYTSCYTTALVVSGKLAKLAIRCKGSASSWPQIAGVLYDVAGPGAGRVEEAVTFAWQDDAVMSKLQEAITAELGPVEQVEIPSELRQPYEKLFSPMTGLAVGVSCGCEVASEPDGWRYTRALVKHNRMDLLRNVMRGMNPEGRIYAVIALLRHAPSLSEQDAATIARIRASRTPVSTCSSGDHRLEAANGVIIRALESRGWP